MQQWWLYAVAVLVTMLLSLGNVMLKSVATKLAGVLSALRNFEFHPLLAISPQIVLIGSIYVSGASLWLWVLNQLPLNRAFMFVSLTFIFVPVLSHIVLGERIGIGVVIGTPIIIAGLLTAVLLG